MKLRKVYHPGDGDIEVSLTHIQNLAEAVELSLQRGVNGTYNIADNQVYSLKNIVNNVLSEGKYNLRWISLSVSIFRKAASLTSWIGIKSPISHQALDYLTISFQLDTQNAKMNLGYQGHHEFDFEILTKN